MKGSRLAGSGWFAAPNFIFEDDLDTYEIAILVNLYRRAGPDGEAWPSLKTIAQDTGMSKPTVKRRLGDLIDKGWVHKQTRKTAKGNRSNLYILTEPVRLRGGVTETPRGDHTDPGVGSERSGVGSDRATEEDTVKDEEVKDKEEEDNGSSSSLLSQKQKDVRDELERYVDDDPSALEVLAVKITERHGNRNIDLIGELRSWDRRKLQGKKVVSADRAERLLLGGKQSGGWLSYAIEQMDKDIEQVDTPEPRSWTCSGCGRRQESFPEEIGGRMALLCTNCGGCVEVKE